ncbi:sigma-70 family RNA polymerase sigma factor [Aliikangiella sp. IMCC44632]
MLQSRQQADNLVYLPLSQTPQRPTIMQSVPTAEENTAKIWAEHLRAIARQRDKASYQAIYLHFAPKVKAFYLQKGLKAQAEELTHEVFLKVWQKAETYQASKAQVSTWIFTIVRNLRIDYLRKKRVVEVSDEAVEETGEIAAHIEQVHQQRTNLQLKDIINELNEEQRNVLQKVYFEDKSHQIAADELSMTVGVVKSRIRSALKILRSKMGGESL